MGRFKYTDSEKETLRVLKMQEQQLAKLQENITCDNDNAQHDKEELAVLRDQIENMLQKRGVYLSNNKDKSVPKIDIKVKKSDIPTWSECAAQADEVINEDVEFEDLLSQEEFNYCIEDLLKQEFLIKKTFLF